VNDRYTSDAHRLHIKH